MSGSVELSERERQIVELVARDGLAYKMVARRLDLSVNTVSAYVSALAKRLPGPGTPLSRMIRHYYRQNSTP